MAVANSTCTARGNRPIPTALEPVSSVLKKLSDAEQAGLRRILTTPIDFMPHDDFRKAATPKKLFGDAFKAAGSLRPWCNAARVGGQPAKASGTISKTLATDEEKTLFLKLNYARGRVAAILEKFAGKRLTAQAVREALWWHAHANKTRCEIVQANIPLVLAMAKRTKLGNIDYAELISEGNMALLRSVDKFDCGRGFKFSTYACRAILKSFSRVAMKIARYRGRFPVEFDPSLERSDYLEHLRQGQEADCVDELRGIIQCNTASLNEVEVKVLRARFALSQVSGLEEGDGPKTLEQVGTMIGVTKERVRQIQNKALQKLKDTLQDDFLAA